MKVRAKFKCNEVRRIETNVYTGKDADGRTTYGPCEMRTVLFSPVYPNNDPEHENNKFWRATPSGKVELGCINLEAAQQFELGKEYYLTFEAAE